MRLEAIAQQTLADIRAQGLYKGERLLHSPQAAHVQLADGQSVLNLCANNYLGLANHPAVVAAAHEGLDRWGYGLSSVRFICGTQDVHKQLERRLSEFLATDDTLLYGSCFDANGGLFEALLSDEDAVISDQLNHASIIDGIRLCKARRYRYANGDMQDLRQQLQAASDAGARAKLITTDGVFSMDGYIARLDQICELADEFEALVHVDDCHATGFLGDRGRGTHEHRGVMGRIDLITGTLGKALGGASGGFTSGRGVLVELLRQRSRPYLFSNSVPPPIVAASLKALEIAEHGDDLRQRLRDNTTHFRRRLLDAGFQVLPGEHPIVPIMLGDARLAVALAEGALRRGVYVIPFSYPVVPQAQARIRTQVSAAHTLADLDLAVDALNAARQEVAA